MFPLPKEIHMHVCTFWENIYYLFVKCETHNTMSSFDKLNPNFGKQTRKNFVEGKYEVSASFLLTYKILAFATLSKIQE